MSKSQKLFSGACTSPTKKTSAQSEGPYPCIILHMQFTPAVLVCPESAAHYPGFDVDPDVGSDPGSGSDHDDDPADAGDRYPDAADPVSDLTSDVYYDASADPDSAPAAADYSAPSAADGKKRPLS